MDWSLVFIVMAGAILFYIGASLSTYSSFALYGAITLFLVGAGIIPLLGKEEGETIPAAKKKKR